MQKNNLSTMNRLKKILFISPPNPFLANPHSVPRLGLYYLASPLKKAGHQVKVQHLGSLDEIQPLCQIPWDIIGISATTIEYPDALNILNYVKRIGHKAIVALGGAHATAMPSEAMRNGFDLVVTGEADIDIVPLVESTWEGQRLHRAGFIKDLDAITYPDRESVAIEDWKPFMSLKQTSHLKTASILLSRGCPFHCAFCGPHFMYRRRSNANIAGELQLLKDRGYDALVILDDLPFINEQQVKEFCELIKNFDMKFRCNFRTDIFNDSMAEMLSQAGCQRVQFGIESAECSVLNEINKGTTPEKNGAAIRICRHFGIQSKAMFVWGFSRDNKETAQSIIKWVEHFRPDSIQVSWLAPLPESPLWKIGHQTEIVDYRQLNFFPQKRDVLRKKGIRGQLYCKILDACSRMVHIDRGMMIAS
jgi:anaerobic magnesium-protoporphyrin IX monomethyl ester cyclase